jgi:hypothetical protein
MEFLLVLLFVFAAALVVFALHITIAMTNYFADETTEKGYWERVLNNRTYSHLRDIYHNPGKVNRLSRRKLNKYLETLVRSISPLDLDTYSELMAILISSRKITRKRLVWLWEISLHNYIVKEAVAKHPKLPEETRTLYALQLMSNTAY